MVQRKSKGRKPALAWNEEQYLEEVLEKCAIGPEERVAGKDILSKSRIVKEKQLAVLEQAKERKLLVEKRSGKAVFYELLEAGREEYLKAQPVPKVVELFHGRIAEFQEKLEDSRRHAVQLLDRFGKEMPVFSPPDLEATLQSLKTEGEKVVKIFEGLLHAGNAFISLNALQKQIEATFKTASQAFEKKAANILAKLDQEKKSQAERQLKWDKELAQLKQWQAVLSEQIKSPQPPLTEKQQQPHALPTAPQQQQVYPEARICEEMEKAYRRIVEKDRLRAFPEIAKVYREVLPYLPGLTPAQFMETIKKLKAQGKVDTDEVNDSDGVREPEFAIKTVSGWIYYVSWK